MENLIFLCSAGFNLLCTICHLSKGFLNDWIERCQNLSYTNLLGIAFTHATLQNPVFCLFLSPINLHEIPESKLACIDQ